MLGDERAATPSAPPSATWLGVFRSAVLIAVLASTALYVHYLSPADSGFCGLHSGCEDVRRSTISYFFGSRFLSVPLVGLVAYASVFALSVADPFGRTVPVLARVGALVAIALLGAQALVIHAFCWLCTIVDAAAVVAAVAAGLQRGGNVEPLDPLKRSAWVALLAFAIGAPIGWSVVKPAPPVPAVIRAEYLPDEINVIEFADFECPFCRRLHPLLKRVMSTYPPARVRFVRKHVPLEMHPEARPAARAAICAEAQGKGEALADKLVQIELTPSTIRRAAVEVGVDAGAFDRCLESTEPDARIAADTKLLEEAGMEGLPTTYVGGTRLLGVVSEAALRDAFDRAERNETASGVPAPLYWALVLAAVGAVAWLGRSERDMMKNGSRSQRTA